MDSEKTIEIVEKGVEIVDSESEKFRTPTALPPLSFAKRLAEKSSLVSGNSAKDLLSLKNGRTPDPAVAELLDGEQGEASSLEYASMLVNGLSAFIASKANIHGEVRKLVTKIQKAMLEANKDWKTREETIRKKAAELEGTATPRASIKRGRPSPNLSPGSQTQSAAKVPRPFRPRIDKNKEWEVVEHRKRKKPKPKPTEPKPDKKPQPREARKVRPKADALLIKATDENSYADILRKVKGDTALKDLGTQVTRIRRTRDGGMLFELKGDPLVKSEAYKVIMQKTLGSDATVSALTQEIVVEVINLDEITTEEELRTALIEQFSLGETGVTAKVRMRKAYFGTQVATIKLPLAEANKLLEAGKAKVGWTICQLRAPRAQLLRCYKCLGFGHVATHCNGTDRSKRCWKCGEDGHFSMKCLNKPSCMLCQKSKGNDHATGSLKCEAYKEAKSRQGWR